MIINQKQAREQEIYNHYSIYKNTIDFNKYPLFNNIFSQEHKDKISQAKEQYHNHKTRFKNISFDISNLKNYSVYNYPYKKLMREQDKNKYKIINKKPLYNDISLFQILKKFYKQHKISKIIFKKSIKIITEQESIIKHNDLIRFYCWFDKTRAREFKKIPRLNNKVLGLINFYYKTIRTATNKNTITALKRQQDKRTRININGYAVLIKNRYSQILNNHIIKQDLNTYSKGRIKLIYSVIEQEFNKKLIQDNKTI